MAQIGMIGMGIVGGTTAKVFEKAHKIFPYDKYKSPHNTSESLQRLAENSDYVFLCVPTPMNPSGQIDYSAVDDSLDTLADASRAAKRDLEKIVVVIRSTAVSGTTDEREKKYSFQFAFNPEFLTEKNALADMQSTDRVVIGANNPEIAKRIVEEVYKPIFPDAKYILTNAKTAEMIKYSANVMLAGQVAIANELYQICQKLGIEYADVKNAILLDKRIGRNINVPGPDGDLGFGGKCLIAGTKIRKKNKIVNIEELKIGDKIYDENGLTEVTNFGKRRVGETILICARGREIVGSKDHIQIVVEKNKLVKKELRDIKLGHLIYVPKQKEFNSTEIDLGKRPNNYVKNWNEKLKVNRSLARLIGLYLSEGCAGAYSKNNKQNKSYEVIWSFGEIEKDLAEETFSMLKGLGLNPFLRLQISKGTYGISRCWIVRIRSQWFYTLIKKMNIGCGAIDKNPPLFPAELAKSMIGGWFDGGGNYSKGILSGTSVSKNLILAMDSLLLSLGINAQIHPICCDSWTLRISMRDDVREISSWTKSKRLRFDSKRYKRDFSYASPTSKPFKDGWAVKINKIEELSGQEVYSLETKSHKYLANNILTHNCFPKDIRALTHLAMEHWYDPSLLLEIWRLNERVRKNKDWLDIPGATSRNSDFKKE